MQIQTYKLRGCVTAACVEMDGRQTMTIQNSRCTKEKDPARIKRIYRLAFAFRAIFSCW
jgi:hypothetical protein